MHQDKTKDSGMRIRNWEKFQHYSDSGRRMVWIKLHTKLLDDIAFARLSDRAARVLVMLWMLASEDSGNLPDVDTIAFRLRLKEKDIMEALAQLSEWLENDSSEPLAGVYQDPSLEESRGEKREEKKEEGDTRVPALVVESVDPQFLRVWDGLGKYGVRKKALDYWRRYGQPDRDAIEAAAPGYMAAVDAGRKQMQAEGWLNPQHRRWDMDWSKALQVESAAVSSGGQRAWIGGLGTGGL